MPLKRKPPGFLSALCTAILLACPLLAMWYAGWKLFGLPFVPFDFFDWLTRHLPGGVIRFGIGNMVAMIGDLNLGPTASTAKTIEQSMGVVFVGAALLMAAFVFFFTARLWLRKIDWIVGLLLAMAMAVPPVFISDSVGNTALTSGGLSAMWILETFALWGLALGWIYHRLATVERDLEVTAESAALRQSSNPNEPLRWNPPAATTPQPSVVTEINPTPDLQAVRRLDRRRFLIRAGGASALITLNGALLGELLNSSSSNETQGGNSTLASTSNPGGLWSAYNPLPNADAKLKPAPGTRAEFTKPKDHYRIDIDAVPPHVNLTNWKLKIGGLVDHPMSLTMEQIKKYPAMHQFITLECISNRVGGSLIGTTRWTGFSAQLLLDDMKPKSSASHLLMLAEDGYFEVVGIDEIRADKRIMFCYEWDGQPLLPEHGFPLRIYIPNLYGMKQPKWIKAIQVLDQPQPGYWVQRGWINDAKVKMTSVIDTVAVKYKSSGETPTVPVGGIAFAGSAAISKVEVKIDNGPWQTAQLRKPMSDLTWVIWRYDWPFNPGDHTFSVRCHDGGGTMQSDVIAPPDPSGASGFDSKSATV